MRKSLFLLLSLLLPLFSVAGEPIVTVGGYTKTVPASATVFLDPSGNPLVVSAANPLPVTGGSGGGGGGSTTFSDPQSFRLSDGTQWLSVATDRTTAAAPFSFRLSDGSSFISPALASQLPTALGQKTSANSLPVVIASDDFLPVSATVPVITNPPSAQSLAATGTFQFSVQGGSVVALTLTNAPAATAGWVATVGFEWSADGSSWTTLNATPRSTLPGASAVQASSTTAPGLWLAPLPVNAAFLRYNVSAWTSGTVWGFVEVWNQPNGIIQLPWTPTVTSGVTLAGWFDASGLNALLVRISAVTTTVVTVQGTNDPTGTDIDTISVQDTKTANATGATTITAANTFRALLVGHKWVRVQVTTTGTVLTVRGITATMGSTVGLTSLGSSITAGVGQVAGSTAVSAIGAGGSNRALGIALLGPTNVADAASSARTTSGNSGTNTDETGGALSGLLAVTAVSGTSPTLDVVLRETYDNGVTFQDVYHLPRITATGTIRLPAIPANGRRRWDWTISGTSPSFTFSINSTRISGLVPVLRQYFDRTAGVLSGTLSNATSGYDVAGCKIINARILLGAATTPATYQIQVSDDLVNWSNVGTATAAVASASTNLSVVNVAAGYARVICTSAATAQTGTYISISGSN